MSLDLGPAIEIAIGLAFVFFLLSLVASALTEWISNLLKLRSKNLRKGLEGILGDANVASQLLKHPLVRTDSGRRRRHDPSYISPRQFAIAFRDLLHVPDPAEGSRRPTVQVKEADGRSHRSEVSAELETQLCAISGSAGALPPASVLEKWFDESMDRVSGWYKRQTQLVAFLVAVIVTIGLNASALRVADHLAAEPTVRAAVVARAETPAKEAEGKRKGSESLETAGKDMEDAVDKLAALKLPIFWSSVNAPAWTATGVSSTVVGWLITVLAISLGAPFWFDTLSKLSNLRMAGRRPEDKPTGPTAP